MARFPRFTSRTAIILAHDVGAAAAALVGSFYVRFSDAEFYARLPTLLMFMPVFLVYSAFVFGAFNLYKGKWRFFSTNEIIEIVKSATVIALTLLIVDYIVVSPAVMGVFFFGKKILMIYWLLQIFFLGGTRFAYRYFRLTRTRKAGKGANATPTLVIGRAADAEVLLRAVENGAVKRLSIVGVLSPSSSDRGQTIRGVPVLGNLEEFQTAVDDLESRGARPTNIVLTPSAFEENKKLEAILARARKLGLKSSKLPSLDTREQLQLSPVNVEDLLLRPRVAIEYDRLSDLVRGQSIAVTGGGGSIGSELCERIVAFGAERLLVIENSEPALHAVMEKLASFPEASHIQGRLADVRERDRIFRLLTDFKPDLVFHAAALKHVPLLETDWEEGVKTNIFGSVNVADAAAAAGASAMVLISTDKAIAPTSVLGATKRIAEMYCQALDREPARRADGRRTRFIAVRFGNVLASNGSVVPKFKEQIAAGGPVTVTHPEMVRYFMTIREACDLVITAASHAHQASLPTASVYMLNMGQPVKIVDLAEKLIAMSGLKPGVDIEIVFTGIRPGERLSEALFADKEVVTDIGISGVMAAQTGSRDLAAMREWIITLERLIANGDRSEAYGQIRDIVPEFKDAKAACRDAAPERAHDNLRRTGT